MAGLQPGRRGRGLKNWRLESRQHRRAGTPAPRGRNCRVEFIYIRYRLYPAEVRRWPGEEAGRDILGPERRSGGARKRSGLVVPQGACHAGVRSRGAILSASRRSNRGKPFWDRFRAGGRAWPLRVEGRQASSSYVKPFNLKKYLELNGWASFTWYKKNTRPGRGD